MGDQKGIRPANPIVAVGIRKAEPMRINLWRPQKNWQALVIAIIFYKDVISFAPDPNLSPRPNSIDACSLDASVCAPSHQILATRRHWVVMAVVGDCVAEGRLALMLGMYQKEGLGRERAMVERRRRQAVGRTNKLSGGASDSTVRRFNPTHHVH